MSIRSGQGDHAALAMRAYQRAIAYDPADAETKMLLGNQYLSAGEPDKAIALVKNALATDPLSRAGQLVLASAYAATGDYAEAQRTYERVIILFPKYTSGRVGYAQMLMFSLGRLDEAILVLDDPAVRAAGSVGDAASRCLLCQSRHGVRLSRHGHDHRSQIAGRADRTRGAAPI